MSQGRMIFVNLPVHELARAVAFHEAVGGRRDERFCTEDSAMIRYSDTIAVMLLEHRRFSDFTDKAIIDARTQVEVLIALSAADRDEVDATIEKAVAAGGRADPGPRQDHGFMYGRSYEDPDGHYFEVVWMDVEAAMAARG